MFYRWLNRPEKFSKLYFMPRFHMLHVAAIIHARARSGGGSGRGEAVFLTLPGKIFPPFFRGRRTPLATVTTATSSAYMRKDPIFQFVQGFVQEKNENKIIFGDVVQGSCLCTTVLKSSRLTKKRFCYEFDT